MINFNYFERIIKKDLEKPKTQYNLHKPSKHYYNHPIIKKHTDNGVELITMIPTNPYKCKDEFVEFKESNNWK